MCLDVATKSFSEQSASKTMVQVCLHHTHAHVLLGAGTATTATTATTGTTGTTTTGAAPERHHHHCEGCGARADLRGVCGGMVGERLGLTCGRKQARTAAVAKAGAGPIKV